MRFADLKVVGGHPQPVPLAEIDAAEASLGFPFLQGYRELMTTLGPGLLFNEVGIYGPQRVLHAAKFGSDFEGWVRNGDKPHLTVCHGDGEVVPNADLLRFIRIGGTGFGDSLFLHRGRPGRIYACQRLFHEDEAYSGGGLHLAGEELMAACLYVRPAFSPLTFRPFG